VARADHRHRSRRAPHLHAFPPRCEWAHVEVMPGQRVANVLQVSGSNTVVLHRHGRHVHDHPYARPHRHFRRPRRSQPLETHEHHREHDHQHEHEHPHQPPHGHGEHGHSHGLVDRSIVRSRQGVKVVSISLAVLGVTAVAQLAIFVLSGSVALLADLIHNVGDALTALPLGIAFFMRSFRAEKIAGLFVVAAIFVSACVALYETIQRLINPQELSYLWALAAAGVIGFLGNEIAAQVRLRGGRRLHSPALIADGKHARADGFVSLGVVASAILVAAGLELADPIIGLLITLVILKITWDAWWIVSKSNPGDMVEPHRH
jgi:Co/Zn/Cd efflux system component